MAPASVNPSTTKFCFLSGFLEPLPSASIQRIRPRAPGLEGTLETMWSQLLLKVGVHPGPYQPKPGVFLPLDTCTVMPLAPFTSLLGLHQHLRALTTHPTALCGWVEGSLGLVSHMVIGPTCQWGCQQLASQEREGRDVVLLPLSTDKVSLLIWAFFDV